MDPGVIVFAARFEQEHGVVRISRKAVRKGAASRARANHDIIVGVGHDFISSKRWSRYGMNMRLRQLSEQFLSKPRCIELSDNTSSEEQNARHEDDAGDNCHGEI